MAFRIWFCIGILARIPWVLIYFFVITGLGGRCQDVHCVFSDHTYVQSLDVLRADMADSWTT